MLCAIHSMKSGNSYFGGGGWGAITLIKLQWQVL